ncbi:MAG: ABC transporter substrate-binding protein [Deltaproteobacteria bacterium]|jgi:polar amino acid transport system substrate-binding protein|nr:ABC transporter substrate-binding protein [Deltaproteobacteria bacterium]
MLKQIFRLLAVLIFAFICCPLGSSLFAKDAPLVNGIDAKYPPFAYIAESGEAQGFDIDMINWIAKKKGLSVVHQAFDWSSIVTNLKDKKLDLIASGLSVTAERAEQVTFSNPYWKVKQVVLVKADSPLTLDEVLKGGKTIGLQSGTSELASMEKANGQDGRKYTITGFESADMSIQDVINGRIDAAVMNDSKATEFLEKFPVKALGLAGIPDEDYAIAVNKESVELLKVLNEGLAEIQKDPIWAELIKKHQLIEPLF